MMTPRLLIAILAMAFLGGVAAYVVSVVRQAEPATHPPEITCLELQQSDKLKALGFEALDNAFRTHLEHLFEIAMKDATDQPRRMRVGTQNAIHGWVTSYNFIVQYHRPECPK